MNPGMRTVARLLRGGVVHRRRFNPVLWIQHWRWEIALLAGIVALVQLGRADGWGVPVVAALVVGMLVVPFAGARRAVRDRCRAVVAQHRLRTAFDELGLTTWAGRAPAIVWTSARNGVHIYVWCPAGIGPSELEAVREQLAGACFAADVRVERDPRRAHVAILTIDY